MVIRKSQTFTLSILDEQPMPKRQRLKTSAILELVEASSPSSMTTTTKPPTTMTPTTTATTTDVTVAEAAVSNSFPSCCSATASFLPFVAFASEAGVAGLPFAGWPTAPILGSRACNNIAVQSMDRALSFEPADAFRLVLQLMRMTAITVLQAVIASKFLVKKSQNLIICPHTLAAVSALLHYK